MPNPHPRSTAAIMGHPLHPALIPFPIALFISAFVTDLLFVVTHEAGWAVGSRWLLIGGLAGALLAAMAGLADFLGDRRIREIRSAWWHMIGNVTAVAIEAVNLVLRLGDKATSAITPTGIILSGIVLVLLSLTGWFGGELVFRYGVGVVDDPAGR